MTRYNFQSIEIIFLSSSYLSTKITLLLITSTFLKRLPHLPTFVTQSSTSRSMGH